MSTTKPGRDRWIADLQAARFIAETMHHQTSLAAKPTPFGASAQGAMWDMPLGQLVRKYDDDSSLADSPIGSVISLAAEAVRALLTRQQPLMTDQVASDAAAIVEAIDRALAVVQQADPEPESVEDVVDALERDYLLSLAITLTGQGVIVSKLADWERGGGDYLDVATFRLVRAGGVGRVHMRHVRAATDAGLVTILAGPNGGLRTFDRYPTLQYMLYSQWFTYIHALWDEQYRARIATAHGDAPDGKPWIKSDIRIELFGDIRNIRNDVVHKRGVAHDSVKNTHLRWFEEDQNLHATTEQMLSLVMAFPRTELLAEPKRAEPGNPTQFPWNVAPELVEEVKARAQAIGWTRRQRQDIGNEALRLWLEAHSMKRD
ncbi:hypothetical protein AB0M12_36855 [Nocardia vinacea]|uniref:hypothetical protein n=1 Tax=Nocardia vinacea TaxID=96468 RepID=UPI00342AA11F